MKLKIALLCLFTANTYAIPVFDYPNWVTNAKNWVELAAQTKNQISHYQSQLLHYKDIVSNAETNMKSLSSFEWDNASQIIDKLVEQTDTLDRYKAEAGSLEKHLERFQSSEFYLKGKCFNGSCTKAEMDKIKQSRLQSSVAEKRANDAMIRGIDAQQKQLKADSKTLRVLQQKAQSSEGQKQALQAAAQLASNQSHQLLQIRGLLMAQQNAEATRYASLSNKEAIKEAGDERFRQGEYTKSKPMKW